MKKDIYATNGIDWREVAEDAATKAHENVETIIFEDGTVSTVSGAWEARKPVLVVLGKGHYTKKEVMEAIAQPLFYLEMAV